MKGFSLIVCTHNPDLILFEEVIINLFAIVSNSKVPVEIVIVDNNSSIPLEKNFVSADWKFDISQLKIVREERPGLTFARIAGYQSARYDWMIFVDDDNLPGIEYVNELEKLTDQLPEVKCWGAGKIEVVYTGQKETAFLTSIRPLFQERNFKGVNYSCNIKGEDFYPPGSCMCVKKIAFEKYYNLIMKGVITSSDRTGSSLNSAGDTQIIYCCIKNGFSVGSSEKLTLKHLINQKKTSNAYLLKLKYALSSCQVNAYNEVFSNDPIPVKAATSKEILKSIYSSIRINGLFPFKKKILDIASLMGEFNGRHLAGNFARPFLLRMFEQLIGHK
jgi:glycosyltransferase involved in cell wall biosynthesis